MKQWCKDRVVYQIYPRSFQDSNGDGIGDIKGIIRRLPELKELGIGTIWLSPLYCSPNADNGYDISDYCNINPEYGTMADMDALLASAKQLDLKIIMDLVINHTSDEHEWFQKSRDKDSEYRDYYIWRPAKADGKAPNNWTSFFAEDCWELDEKSGEYYLHLFAKKQPDLNYHNPKVIEEVKNILRFWLDKGVSGFRCDVINVLYKSSLEDGKKQMFLLGSEHYISQEGNHEILRELREEVLDKYDCFTVGETVFVNTKMGRDLTDTNRHELDMIFSFEHMETDQYFVKWFKHRFNAKKFGQTFERWQNALEWNANYFENHDQPRSVSRFGNDGKYWEQSAKMLCTMLMSLRGTPYIYQGEEIGMTNFDFTGMEQLNDVESKNVDTMMKRLHFPHCLRWYLIKKTSRDNARTPMQWDSSENAGFTVGKPWLGINSNYRNINVEAQKKDPFSIRSYYRDMIRIRSLSETLRYGSFKLLESDRSVLVYTRKFEGRHATVMLNFSGRKKRVKYAGQVVISSAGRDSYDGVLMPYEGIILNEGIKL
ncbi:MAG: alpha-glucosidase [Oscillospiraceae bacterium]